MLTDNSMLLEEVDLENSSTQKLNSDDISNPLKPDSAQQISVETKNLALHRIEVTSKNDKADSNAPQSLLSQSNTTKCKSPLPKTAETRHFQKTRSFSAVEEKPDTKIPKNQLSAVDDFPLKDVAHSRSEHLETQSLQPNDSSSDKKSKLIASSSTVVDQSDSMMKGEPSGKAVEGPSTLSGDTLIMQFDYFSNDQPMSLQHDARFNGAATQTDSTHLRKSVRDLTELETEAVSRAGFERASETNRVMWSRPRLEPFVNPTRYMIYPLYRSIVALCCPIDLSSSYNYLGYTLIV